MDDKMVEVKYNGKIYTIPSENNREILRILNGVNDDLLTQKGVTDFNDVSFYIKDYQRGYRWGEEEIKYLLDDIAQFDGNGKYCMQPLVVREVKYNTLLKGYTIDDNSTKEKRAVPVIGKHVYELVDGQQRLTTIHLILKALSNECKYNIYYQLLRPLDERFIDNAKKKIEEYFEGNEPLKSEIAEKIVKNLAFIWYEFKDEESGISANEKFSQINKGKIELTNAELFKAMLLNLAPQNKADEIAFEWDKIEQNLNDDNFWFFISNNSDERHTRIDYILDVYARSVDAENKSGFSSEKERYSYNVVSKYIGEKDKDVFEVWEEIVKVHDKLYSWYCDDELYHNIGFLVACEKKGRAASAAVVSDLYVECNVGKGKTLTETRNIVKGYVYSKLIDELKTSDKENLENTDDDEILKRLNYDNYKNTYMFLLYSNIYYTQYNNKDKNTDGDESGYKQRFPFKDYYYDPISKKAKSWDVEHINPQNPPDDIQKAVVFKDYKKQIREQTRNCKLFLKWLKENAADSEKIDGLLGKDSLRPEDLACLQGEWNSRSRDLQKDNSVTNLVLLDSKTNREYQNAVFNIKRAYIIKKEMEGRYFLPCTRNVFLKYFNDNPANFVCWEDEDAYRYGQFLKGMITEIRKWGKCITAKN